MKKLLIVTIAMVTFFVGCKKDDSPLVSTQNQQKLVDELKAEAKKFNLMSLSFAVIKNGNVLYSAGIGFADSTAKRLATPDSRYLIASISKSITAVAAMKLYEQNLLDLNADVNTYLPFKLRNPNFPTRPITVKMLLNHTSGLSDEHYGMQNLYCYGSDCTMTLADFFNRFYGVGGQYNSPKNFLNAAPGTQESYSNMGSALAGYIVERIAKQPFDTYCKQNIFTPLGMSKTEWRISNTPNNEIAQPYNTFGPKGIYNYSFPDYPNGGLRTTVNDLAKFSIMLLSNNGTYNGVKILNASTVSLMKAKSLPNSDFGLGLILGQLDGTEAIGHDGGERGVLTNMRHNESSKISIIAFTNTDFQPSPDDPNPSDPLEGIRKILYNYGLAN